MIFGPRSNDLHAFAEAQLVDRLGQKVAPAEQWLDKRHPDVRSQQGKRYAGQAGATAYVRHLSACQDQPAQGGTVQNVTIPQSVGLVRTEQAPLDSGRPQNVDISI
jgi:hypothetical protein